ncbi:glycosyltransferase [Duganella sp. FT134W]|uniref:Glycosyltransferase n=1 Tax=Duganella margarita TaxID=2692170 RepID=A0A7X4H765_9BURK|nr:glycosyltransferase [Duganella margarita]MYM76010.1 glycosyltransferase [Duganella margarita]
MKIVLVTNLLAPYRTPVFSAVHALPDTELHVLSCTESEPNRTWDWPPPACPVTLLRPRFVNWRGRYIHCNPDVLAALRDAQPDVIVIDGYNPTHLLAYWYAQRHRIACVQMTDGTCDSERRLSWVHRLVRRVVLRGCLSFVAASRGGQALFDRYGASHAQRFRSCLAVDNAAFGLPAAPPQFDLLFCGRLEPVKNPHFALALALLLARRCRRRIRILFVGAGSELAGLQARAARFPGLVEAVFSGAVPQRALPALYHSARLFVFPSLWDPWGVVVNEACAAGLPVLISPHAGAAGELVREGENGHVLPLVLERWATQAQALLADPSRCQRYAQRGRTLVAGYTFDVAAQGLQQACRRAWQRRQLQLQRPDAYRSHPRVLIVERQLLHYRVDFYEQLRADLAERGIELQLLVGEGTPAEKLKRNEAHLDWAVSIPTRYFLNNRLCWQPYGAHARAADLVVVMHENKLLYNLWLMVRRPRRLAFWGHGANLQSSRPQGWKERFKRWTVRRADWWYAYTDLSAALIAAAGFPPERTTVVQNAVDTRAMRAHCDAWDAKTLAARRRALGLADGPLGVYVGSLHKEKRLAFLFAAAEAVRRQVPDFQLLIVGDGPEQALVDAAIARHAWIRAAGALHDRDKAAVLAMADVMLNPGMVGLGILDSFCAGSPMFTTDCGMHSPEIAYLESGVNGVMTANDIDSYADAVVRVLVSPALLATLRHGARASATRHTLENMAQRISGGIANALATA